MDPLPIEGIAKGLSRKDVVAIDAIQIVPLTLLHQHGLTAAHLRSHPLPYLGFQHYRDALVNLMTQRGSNNKTADQAMAEIDGLHSHQAQGIANGLAREDVIKLNQHQIEAYLTLRQQGLTIAHLQSHPWDSFDGHYYRAALVNLMTGRGTKNRTADEAMAELDGLNRHQAERISHGETRDEVLQKSGRSLRR